MHDHYEGGMDYTCFLLYFMEMENKTPKNNIEIYEFTELLLMINNSVDDKLNKIETSSPLNNGYYRNIHLWIYYFIFN
jgi:hypothetical protein